jgi:hypothetical protein
MPTYADLGKIAADPGFQSRVDYAMANAALAIYSEAPTQKTPTRVVYARQVLGSGYDHQRAALGVLENAAVAAMAVLATGSPDYSVTDAAIQNAVSAMWNAFAGA